MLNLLYFLLTLFVSTWFPTTSLLLHLFRCLFCYFHWILLFNYRGFLIRYYFGSLWLLFWLLIFQHNFFKLFSYFAKNKINICSSLCWYLVKGDSVFLGKGKTVLFWYLSEIVEIRLVTNQHDNNFTFTELFFVINKWNTDLFIPIL